MSANGTELSLKSTVDLSCWLNKSFYRRHCNIVLLHNHSIISSSSSPNSSIRAQILLNTFGRQTFECDCKAPRPQRICGIYVVVGIAPDQPKNVSCAQYGKYGPTICSWDKGYYTYLFTTYTLWVTNETSNGTVLGEKTSTTVNTVDLRKKLDFETTYTVVVKATNKLGSNSSEPMQFTLIDIVKPHPPVNLSVSCDAFVPQNCTIFWQDQQETQGFRLRYQPIHSNSWITLENLNAKRYDLHDLQPKTKYEFQVSCRLLLERGLWSDWSTAFQTEAVPFEPVDVWYLKETSSKMQNITLFWKSKNVQGIISQNFQYQVIFQNLNQMPPKTADMSVTTHTVFSHVSLKADYNITLNSKNSRGVSPSVYITTKLGITELLPPNQVSATTMENERIVVEWEAPSAPPSFINGYIVEWVEIPQDYHRNNISPTWFKIPVSNCTVIKENLKPNVCYLISVFALYRDRAGKAATTTENISAKAPLTGPQIVNVTVEGGSILVSWREVPEDQRMGCIISYKIYLQKQFFSTPLDVHELSKPAPQPFYIKNIEAGASYVIWMTASTNAGESPKGNEELIYIKTGGFIDATDWVPIVAISIIIGLSVFFCCIPAVRQKIFSLFSALVFGWYPDPANSTWAKEFTSTKDESSSNSTVFLSHPVRSKDPETLQIKETLIERQGFTFMDGHIYKNICKTEALSMRTNNCNSLTTNITNSTGSYQLPSLYKKLIPEDPNESQVFSECLVNPLEDATVDYLPTITPAIMTSEEDSSGSELSSLPIFPITSFRRNPGFLGGKLTLDAIKMDCNSFTENPFLRAEI
ncbi:interleukin-12 receptor subunit beta-2 [Thamnophis elegans]|uniref:interleukin-12 receptor subunit beta-2 n=1 Tax=Thamnophis elegans TaxID=35005 RepID=UPI001378E9D9|nr:interleukin-12 receptor subunit beta-2 [Thamnophis elegans]